MSLINLYDHFLGFCDSVLSETQVFNAIKERVEVNVAEIDKVIIICSDRIEGVQVANPKGAFYCIAQLPIKDSDAFAQWLLESFDVNGETVMVAPAAGFYSTPGIGLNQIRIAYVLNTDSLVKAVNIIKEALKVYRD